MTSIACSNSQLFVIVLPAKNTKNSSWIVIELVAKALEVAIGLHPK
jgi:hypothetical protein